uniref:Uncharacterized protein n=1 Tax=Rhizophora mucronata TaxID=61149 RepID=A0A2P2NT26_RHIMU
MHNSEKNQFKQMVRMFLQQIAVPIISYQMPITIEYQDSSIS